MSTSPLYFEPIARPEYVRSRLALRRPALGDIRVDWDEVQQAVQEVLAVLGAIVQRRRPDVRSRPGGNRSPAVALYEYRVFDPGSSPDADPVVAGVAFKRTPRGILVRGDFCGEESGKVYWGPSACSREVPEDGRAVLDAASDVAARLAREADRLVDLLDTAEPA